MKDLREVLGDLGPIEVEIEGDEIITDVVVLLRTQKLQDTDDCLVIGSTENTGGIVCAGMIHCAQIQHNEWLMTDPEDHQK